MCCLIYMEKKKEEYLERLEILDVKEFMISQELKVGFGCGRLEKEKMIEIREVEKKKIKIFI